MILQVWTIITLCHNSYISLEMFCFFCCWLLCLRFPDETQLSTARDASNSAISGPLTDINITLFDVSFDILLFSFVFCLFLHENPISHSNLLQLIVIMLLKSISMLSISSSFRSKYPHTHHKPFLVSTSIHANERVDIDEYTSLPHLQR